MLELRGAGLLHLTGLGVFLEILCLSVCASVLLLVLRLAGVWVWVCVLPLRVCAALRLAVRLVGGLVVGDRWVWFWCCVVFLDLA